MLLPGLPAILEGILETMLPGGPPIEIGACFRAARVRLLRGRMAHTRLPVYVIDAPLLYGRWAVRYTNPPAGLPATATLVLQRHAEFSESLAGTVTRSSTGVAQAPAALAGDLDGGLLLLDESADKIRITATWNGEIVPGSCGLEFAGLWKDMTATADNSPSVAFTLKKLP